MQKGNSVSFTQSHSRLRVTFNRRFFLLALGLAIIFLTPSPSHDFADWIRFGISMGLGIGFFVEGLGTTLYINKQQDYFTLTRFSLLGFFHKRFPLNTLKNANMDLVSNKLRFYLELASNQRLYPVNGYFLSRKKSQLKRCIHGINTFINTAQKSPLKKEKMPKMKEPSQKSVVFSDGDNVIQRNPEKPKLLPILAIIIMASLALGLFYSY